MGSWAWVNCCSSLLQWYIWRDEQSLYRLDSSSPRLHIYLRVEGGSIPNKHASSQSLEMIKQYIDFTVSLARHYHNLGDNNPSERGVFPYLPYPFILSREFLEDRYINEIPSSPAMTSLILSRSRPASEASICSLDHRSSERFNHSSGRSEMYSHHSSVHQRDHLRSTRFALAKAPITDIRSLESPLVIITFAMALW